MSDANKTQEAPRLPIDPAAILAPVKSIQIDGQPFEWDEETDGPWSSDDSGSGWTFPTKGWGDNHRASWIGTHGHLIAVKREHEATLAEGDAYAASPEFQIANAQAEVSETIRQREIDGRRLEGVKRWVAARAQYGADRVRAIPCVTGDTVIMVGMSAKEGDTANSAALMARNLRLKSDPDNIAIAAADYIGTQRNWMVSKCVSPTPERIREIAEVHFSLWSDLEDARDDMARARVDAEGKDFAR